MSDRNPQIAGLWRKVWPPLCGAGLALSMILSLSAPQSEASIGPSYVVLGYNELGMHCMNQDFSEICILPPFNNFRAQILRRGEEPHIVSSGATVKYSIPGNTSSVKHTNFWQFAPLLFGKNLPANVGLTGNGLAGVMQPTGANDWIATGIPITPLNDRNQLNPYQLGKIDVYVQNKAVASTAAVVPVSWEISCNLCHNTPNISVAADILLKHDKLHGTKLANAKPVLCAKCHADPALGTTGAPGVKTMSHAMHGSHASRMAGLGNVGNACYACHPGFKTNCQRDVHFAKGILCVNCHGDMTAVANQNRRPWLDEPTCGSCHQKRRPNWEFEETGKMFKDSRGHGGVHCAACHGPQHATGPALTAADNAQAIRVQGVAGTIRKCTVCHTQQPDDGFFHSRGEGSDDARERTRAALTKQRKAARQVQAAALQAAAAQTAAQSPLGTYTITGTEKGMLQNKMASLQFQGTLVTLAPTLVQFNKVYQNGTTSQVQVPLQGAIGTNNLQQTGTFQSGNLVTTYTLTFAKTNTGFAVNGSSATVQMLSTKKAGATVGGSAFTGAK